MVAHKNERRLSDRIEAQEEIFVSINNSLCKVHDISLDGVAFDYKVDSEAQIKPSATLEIFFMSGPILYVENIPYTIVADIPLEDDDSEYNEPHRRACTRFDDLNFRQIINFNNLMANHP